MMRDLRQVRMVLAAVNEALDAAFNTEVSGDVVGHLMEARDGLRLHRQHLESRRDVKLAEIRAEAWAELEVSR